MGEFDFDPFKKRFTEAVPKIESKSPATGSAELDHAVIKLVKSHEKLTKNLADANAKLEAIKKALPDYRILGGWGAGPKAFLEKVKSILEEPSPK